jgi:hypothetical protein
MQLSDELIKELFATDAFKEAVQQYLKENLQISVKVNNGGDYQQRDNCVNVEVELSLADDIDPNSTFRRSNYFTSSSDSTSVDCSSSNNSW